MRKNLLILVLALIMSAPLSVEAASVSVSLDCPSSAKASSTVSCKVSVKPNDSDLKGIQANIKITGGTYTSFTLGSGWTAYSNSSSGFSLGRNSATTSLVTVGTLKVKMPSSGSVTVSLTNVAGSDSSYSTLSGNSPSKTIKVQSTVNTLNSLSISDGTLSPSFDPNTTNYKATVNASSVTISGSATDSSAKVKGLGKKSLDYGQNTFSVVVTSESGSKKTYTITITRPDTRNNNNNLKTLSVNPGSITFNKKTTTYKVNVDSNVKSIKVNATLEDSKASFVKGNGPRTVDLAYGNNNINIKVKAENGIIKTYTIIVNRKDPRSSDSTLSNLSIEPATINFEPNVTTYDVVVPYDVENIKLLYQVNDDKAKVKVSGDESLKVGNNKIIIAVTAENGNTSKYTLNVVRQKEGEKILNNDSTLNSLNINGVNVELTNSKMYIVELEEEAIPNIEATATQTTSSVNVSKLDKLVDGSIVSIVVTAEDGTSSTYLVSTIIKESHSSSSNSNVFKYIILTFIVTEILNAIIYKLFLLKREQED